MESGKYGPRTADVQAFFEALKVLTARDWMEVSRRWDSFQNKPWGTAMLVTGVKARNAGLNGIDQVVETDAIDAAIHLTSDFGDELGMEPEDYVLVELKWGKATVVAAKALAWRDVMDPDLFNMLWSPFQRKVSIPGVVFRGGGCLFAFFGLLKAS
jgi:hypothetical protein